MNTKINLADLSYVLEQELHSVEEDNATYQAAIATYEHEQHYVKYVYSGAMRGQWVRQ